jgi:hypothetical protein
VLARHEPGWSDTKGDPEGGIALYNSTDVLTQNLMVVDSTGGKAFESAIYHPSNSRPSMNVRNVGAVVLNSGGNGVCWEGEATVRGMTLENSVIAKTVGVGACTNGGDAQVSLKNVTITGTGSHGIANWGKGEMTLADSLVSRIGGEQYKGAVKASNVLATVPKWPVRSDIALGANVLVRNGKGGTLWGEVGYDQPLTESLWPWPNQALIKKAMCTDVAVTTGFCGAPSLTDYVWTFLGNAVPAGVTTQ